jgi:hypothetical protein
MIGKPLVEQLSEVEVDYIVVDTPDMTLSKPVTPQEVKEKLKSLIDWLGGSERLYFSQRKALSLLLLKLAAEIGSVISKPSVHDLEQRTFTSEAEQQEYLNRF